jgi:hypothetical protein
MSILPSDTPRLPKWPFLVGDAALLGVAVLIALRSPQPFTAAAVLTIAGCVALAALLGSIPFLSDYAARQDEALDERQRNLEALTRTLADAAEQISIAANGLHELNDLAQKQLHQAQQLPKQLSAQLHDHDRQLNEAAMKENATLREQLETLRAAGIADLKSATATLQETTTALTKREAAAAKQFDAVQSAMAKLPAALDRARDETVQALDKARIAAVEQVATAGHALKAALAAPPAAITPVTPAPAPEPQAAPTPEPEPEPAPTPPPAEEPEPAKAKADEDVADTPSPATPVTVDEPADAVTPAEATDESPEPKPARKPRAPKKSQPADDEAMALDLPPANESSPDRDQEPEADEPTSALTTDGATRVLVTAYIGIGNRLFIRGEGPGLQPDKGVPLQFVSIGKWRWETNEASAPVRFRLFKNDSVECATLGEVAVEPGHQTEITARF